MLSSVSKGSPCSIINKMEKTQQCNECQSQNKKCLKCGKWLNYKKEEDERKEIARLLFTIFFILFLVIIYNWDKVSSNNVWKIIFCFDFFNKKINTISHKLYKCIIFNCTRPQIVIITESEFYQRSTDYSSMSHN